MPAFLGPYNVSLWALAGTATLTVVQLLVADLARIRARITPGTPVPADHTQFAFRAERAHANSVENLSAFALLAVIALLVGAHATALNAATLGYLGTRVAHMLMYYADLRPLRSIAFGGGIVATLVLSGAVVARLV